MVFSVGQHLLLQDGLFHFAPWKMLFYISNSNCFSSKCSLKGAFWNKSTLSEDMGGIFREQMWNSLFLSQKCSPISFVKMLSWQNPFLLKSRHNYRLHTHNELTQPLWEINIFLSLSLPAVVSGNFIQIDYFKLSKWNMCLHFDLYFLTEIK